jgi:hypothetical protein
MVGAASAFQVDRLEQVIAFDQNVAGATGRIEHRQRFRIRGERGYMSVLVDVEEVRALVRGADKGGLTGLEIKDKLSTTAKVAAALIKHGHLKTITVVNPVNRCPTVVVPAEDVERFARKYISLFALAKQQRRHFRKVKQELDDAGTTPAFAPWKIGATFYRRKDLTGN